MGMNVVVRFIDNAGLIATRTFKLSQIDELDASLGYVDAVNKATALVGLLDPVTEAAIASVTVQTDAGGLVGGEAATAESDTTDEAVIQTQLEQTDNFGRPKKYAFAVPAPEEALFVGANTGNPVDTTNAALVALMDWLAAETFVSDGDTIDDTGGNALLLGGYWRSKAKSNRK